MTAEYKYKITYDHYYKALAFVRIADDLKIYVNDNEMYVRIFADGFTAAKNEKYYIE